jgi:hypothetical protein
LSIIGLGIRHVLCAALLSASVALAQIPASPAAGPVPAAVQAAKRVFVSNAGSDSGLFPEPFSGDPSRGYCQFYAALKQAGQIELVDDPSDADLVLELQLTAPYGPTNGSKQNGAAAPLPMFRLVIYDRKTHYALWTLTRSVEFAFLQKTHDRNFDEAVSALARDFGQLSGKPPAAAH